MANSVLEKTRLCDCFAATNALDTRVCRGTGRSRAFIFTNYLARECGLQRSLCEWSNVSCVCERRRKDHLSGSLLSIYLPIYRVPEESKSQPKDTARCGAFDMRNWAIFHELLKMVFLDPWSAGPDKLGRLLCKSEGVGTPAKTARAEPQLLKATSETA
jgi:hypothetical protein